MATIATKLYSTGVYVVNGEFDEFTGIPFVDTAPVLWLDAGQSSSYPASGTIWYDLSSFGYNSTLINSPIYSAPAGGILNFTGSNYVSIPTGAGSTTSPYIVSVWFKTTNSSGTIFSLGTPINPFDYLVLQMSAGKVNFAYDNNPIDLLQTGSNITSTATYNDGQWHNAVAYRDGVRTGKLYVDGVLVATDSDASGATNAVNYTAIEIARNARTQSDYFVGAISVVMAYTSDLTDENILQNYNALAGRYGRSVLGKGRSRITANTVQATEFDEVTYNNSTSFAKRENVNGNVQITGIFDELTSAPIVDGSLVYWVDAGQTSSYPGSGTALTDLSGQAITSTLTGNVEYSNLFNAGCLTFDGNHDYITTSSEFANANYLFADANGAWTVNTWFQFSKAPTTTRTGNQAYMVVGRSGGIATGATFGIFVGSATDTTYGAYVPHRIAVVSRGTVNIISNSSANTGVWNNATVTWDGTVGNIYYNGSFVNTLNTSVGAALQTYNLAVGTTGNTSSTFRFEGNISTVSIYNRALSADEVAQNFNALRRRYNI